MKLTAVLAGAPIRRIAVGVAVSSMAAAGVGIVALTTRPASSTRTQEVQVIDPASDETVVEPTIPAEDLQVVAEGAERAENAAERAETAAGRAEVAATKAETVVTSTTTTTVAPTSTTTTVDTTSTTEQPATTTTTVAKQWVEVARFQLLNQESGAPYPLTTKVWLQTGHLRVTGLPGGYVDGGPVNGSVTAVWSVGSLNGPSGCAVDASPAAKNAPIESECWPAGDVIIAAGTKTQQGRWTVPFGNPSDASGMIIVEEYR